MRHTNIILPRVADAPLEFLTREQLIRRWKTGSASFFYRAESRDLLVPRRCGGLLRYAWDDIFTFEGGPPPVGLEAEYRADLLTATQIGAFCGCSEGRVLADVKAGWLAHRRIGRFVRFVPAEVRLWQQNRWQPGTRRWWGAK